MAALRSKASSRAGPLRAQRGEFGSLGEEEVYGESKVVLGEDEDDVAEYVDPMVVFLERGLPDNMEVDAICLCWSLGCPFNTLRCSGVSIADTLP